MMLHCVITKTVELVDLTEIHKTDCCGETTLVLHTPSSSRAGNLCYYHYAPGCRLGRLPLGLLKRVKFPFLSIIITITDQGTVVRMACGNQETAAGQQLQAHDAIMVLPDAPASCPQP